MQKVILPPQVSREDKMDQIMKSLEQGIKDVYASERFQTYLSVMSRFYKYSANNCVLILMQRPESTFVAGFNA